MLLLKLLQPRIVERYPTRPEFEDMEALSDHEGEPFIIRGKTEMQEEMRGHKPGPSNWKCPRDIGYEVDNDDSDVKLHPNLKKPKQYVIVSEEEDELGELEDDKE